MGCTPPRSEAKVRLSTDAESRPDRVEGGALPEKHFACRLFRPYNFKQRPDDGRSRHDQDGSGQQRQRGRDVEEQGRRSRRARERDRETDTHQPRDGATRLPRQVGQPDAYPTLEQQEANEQCDQWVERVAEQFLGFDQPEHVAGQQPRR